MALKILLVDGYDYDGWKSLNDANCIDAFEHYANTLKSISNIPLEIITIHPGKESNFFPKKYSLSDFNGIIWTGSSLNIYDLTEPIKRQIEFAKETLNNKINIFGTCWGLQVYVVAAGGHVRKNPLGREMIFARNIEIVDNGFTHSMYYGKKHKFDAFCSHLDEVETIPENSQILSMNNHSKVQSLYFKKNDSIFWGTQYHPEFNFNIMSKILLARKSNLISEKIFHNENHANKVILNMEQIMKNESNGDYLQIDDDILNTQIRCRELINWLNFIEKN